MARAAFLTGDILAGHLQAHSSQDADLPAENVEDDRPSIMFQAAEGDGGQFEISTTNQWIDLRVGGVPYSAQVPISGYTRFDLALAATAALNAAGSGLTFGVQFDANHKCRIDASGVFSLEWASGSHAAESAATELGFSPLSDLTGATGYIAPKKRYSTSTWCLFDLGQNKTFYGSAIILDGNDDTDYGTTAPGFLKIFGHASVLGSRLDVWNASASLALSYSPRPANEENTIQVCGQVSGPAYRYYMFGWRHFDESDEHRVGLVRAMIQRLWSTTRTVRELRGHGLVDPSEPISQANYYPTRGEMVWRLPLAFDAWGAADYRATIHPVIRQQRSTPLLVALRWDDILDATVDAEDEADKGLLLWGCVHEYSGDTLTAEGSEYMSGELVIGQIR